MATAAPTGRTAYYAIWWIRQYVKGASDILPSTQSTISVYAIGSTQAEPDRAVISFAVTATDTAVELVRNETARLASASAAAAQGAGIVPTDVATTNFSIYADYD